MTASISRIGFVIDGRLPSLWGAFTGSCRWVELLQGCHSSSAVGVMRFGWIAEAVNRNKTDLLYELFRPWRRYDVVVFLKSMGDDCVLLARRLKQQGVKILFDLNVDYLTPAEGTFYYEGMAPTEKQRENALAMLDIADAVVADSEYLAEKCHAYPRRTEWIPDNVRMDLVPPVRPCSRRERLTLLWSGASCKVFDLLRIESVLRAYAKYLHLVLVTDDWSGVDRCFEPYRSRVGELLAGLEHEIIPFRSVEQLLQVYADGGVFVSPRFLDNTYNWGHTEWKIALPMACGRFVLTSPQPSYVTVSQRSQGRGLKICATLDDWSTQMEALLGGQVDLAEEGRLGRQTIQTHYATDVVARQHASLIREVLQTNGESRSG